MQIDNFVLNDTNIVPKKLIKLIAIDAAFIRGGQLADVPQKLAEGKYIDIKYIGGVTDDPGYREGLIKFDISSLEPESVPYTRFVGNYMNMGADRTFDIYWVDSDWDGETVTYNNAPKGKLIAENITFGGAGAPLELSQYINEALTNGDKAFSIKIAPTFQTGVGQTRIFYDGEENRPTIVIYDERPKNTYFENLVDDKTANSAIWDWAQKLYDEWYVRYQALPAPNDKAKKLEPDSTQYIRSSYASGNSGNYAATKQSYKSRPFEALADLDKFVSDEFKNAERDKFGGIMVESLKQNATGFFYTEKIDGRWFIVDPLGYPYINIGLSHIHYSVNGSTLQKENALKKYGTYENWAIETTKQVRDEFCFNSTFTPREEVKNIDNCLPYMAHFSAMGEYGSAKALRCNGNGSTVFTEKNTMPVFDPDFVEYSDYIINKAVASLVNDPKIIGITSDNELPMDLTMLDNCLTVDHTRPTNYYTYACAWTWLVNITGKESPSFADITDELRDLYRGFVYDRYFYVVSKALKAADPNHIYMGCRFLTVSKDSEWVYRFAAQYLDVMTINWYFCWEPQSDALYGIERNGDMPFIVTEFYTKAGDSGLGNTAGAGWYVATQKDRADYYDTFTIKLLESNNCVGWQWFHYMDNDPNSGTCDRSSINSNKGIYSNDYTVYRELTDRMTILNKNVYNIIDYFANKNAK